MKYIRTVWRHSFDNEPVELWSELDEERMEVRKIEVFRDGRRVIAPPIARESATQLSELPIPSIEEINRDNQFQATEVDRSAFEDEWQRSKQ
jgi:hypothetical protein